MSLPDNVYAFPRQPAAAVEAASTRVPLWNLPAGCHCPVIGSCLGADRLRRVLDALFDARSELSDFELHTGVVRECGSRNRVSECLQDELDRLHAETVRALEDVDSKAGLTEAWIRAAGRGDVAGVLWAILTHPRCEVELAERLMCDLHMIQHRAMGAIGTQLDRGDRLAAENARLRAALAAKFRECEQLRSAPVAPAGHRSRWRRFFAGEASRDRAHAASS